MRTTPIDLLSTPNGNIAAPLSFEQRSGGVRTAIQLALLVPGLIAIIAPFAGFCALVLSDSNFRVVLSERPVSAALVMLGLGLWAVMWGVPALRMFGQVGSKRRVEISNGVVRVVDRTFFARSVWSCPLNAFEGVAHKTRSTISGPCHELVLVHRDNQKFLQVHRAAFISPSETFLVARALGQRVIASGEHAQAPTPIDDTAHGGSERDVAGLAA